MRRLCSISLPLALLLLVALACEENSPTGPKKLDRMPVGAWGGEQISLTVTESGGTFEQFCATGFIEQAILLDADGRFEVTGTYIENRGGPSVMHPARFSGSTDGTTATLTVTLTDSDRRIGPFRFFFGRAVQVSPCPFV